MTTPRRPPKDPLDHDPAAVLAARQATGLTQYDVADALGVSRSLVAEIELGTRNATPPTIEKLAALYGCSVAQLERKRESPPTSPADVDLPDMRIGQRAEPDDVPERQPAPATASTEVRTR